MHLDLKKTRYFIGQILTPPILDESSESPGRNSERQKRLSGKWPRRSAIDFLTVAMSNPLKF